MNYWRTLHLGMETTLVALIVYVCWNLGIWRSINVINNSGIRPPFYYWIYVNTSIKTSAGKCTKCQGTLWRQPTAILCFSPPLRTSIQSWTLSQPPSRSKIWPSWTLSKYSFNTCNQTVNKYCLTDCYYLPVNLSNPPRPWQFRWFSSKRFVS